MAQFRFGQVNYEESVKKGRLKSSNIENHSKESTHPNTPNLRVFDIGKGFIKLIKPFLTYHQYNERCSLILFTPYQCQPIS